MNPAFSTTRPAPAGSPSGLTIRPLSRTVAESMEQYFRALEGHAPKNLYDEILAQIEPPLLNATLKYCRGNQSRAAEMLGLNRATLRKKLAQYAIRAGEHKG